MRKLKLAMQVSLDGFTATLDGNTDWMIWNWSQDWRWDERLRQYHTALISSSDCMLLGRKMAEEGFCEHWAQIASDLNNPQHVFAQPTEAMRKVVFSRTLVASKWKNTELAQGDLATEVKRLKAQQGKDLLAFGGPTFASSLLHAGLIDELHLFVNPALLGQGVCMFSGYPNLTGLRLERATAYDCGVAVLEYANRPASL